MAMMIYMVFGGRAFSAVFRGAMITFVLVFTVTSLQAVKQQVFPTAQTATDIYQPPLAGEPVQQKLVAEPQPSYFLGFKIEHFSTIWHRLETSRTAIDMYLRSPLTGTGMGTFLEAESRDYNYQAASPEGPQ
ncbi:hypothetical protein, partial [Salmonella enterica]|uniref:hypothetical protein n=1 Tax=Salmonella enterica TaxID=28901 RepID=UPI00352358B4